MVYRWEVATAKWAVAWFHTGDPPPLGLCRSRLHNVDTDYRYVSTAADFWAGAAAGCRACGGEPNDRILGWLLGRHDPAADHVQHHSRSQIVLGFAHVGQSAPTRNFRATDPSRRWFATSSRMSSFNSVDSVECLGVSTDGSSSARIARGR